MPLILGANTLTAGGYEVDNSLRFNAGSSDTLTRTNSSTSDTWTFSAWIKRSSITGSNKYLISWGTSGTNGTGIGFSDSGTSSFFYFSEDGGSNRYKLTSASYRDISAWYHVVVKSDSNAITFYVNGEEPTQAWSNGSAGQNLSSSTMTIGNWVTASLYPSNYMAEVVFIDGTALDPTSFGEFDEDSGIWKPIDVSGLTFGTNGFYLDFESSGSLGSDVSGNGNDFTVNNLTAIDQTTDTPTNNFATGNILSPYANRTITDGSLTITSTTTQWTNICSTIGVSSGKWWIELKHTAGSYGGLGIVSPFPQTENNVIGDFSAPVIQQIGYVAASGDKKINNSTSSYGDTWVGTDDIVNMSLNLDDNELKFYKNGTVQDSGTAIAISSGYTYFVGTSNYNSSGSSFNFGNPAFSISSGNADANGYGNFEYAPPAGFLALCTANLSEVLG